MAEQIVTGLIQPDVPAEITVLTEPYISEEQTVQVEIHEVIELTGQEEMAEMVEITVIQELTEAVEEILAAQLVDMTGQVAVVHLLLELTEAVEVQAEADVLPITATPQEQRITAQTITATRLVHLIQVVAVPEAECPKAVAGDILLQQDHTVPIVVVVPVVTGHPSDPVLTHALQEAARHQATILLAEAVVHQEVHLIHHTQEEDADNQFIFQRIKNVK